ncbi:MAG: class I SAM-dependent RNA methyltransferase [Anaerolineales bacterium]|nr:class I SAM-dependent RNA methyltransferase [Anaerolineales bacterium]
MNRYFAACAPGLEPYTTMELQGLGLLSPDENRPENPGAPRGIAGDSGTVEPGGVGFDGDLTALYRANLHLRTAGRVLARLGMAFLSRSFPELEQKAARLPWERFLLAGQPVALRVTCHRSKLYHSDAVARTVARAIAARLDQPLPLHKPGAEEAANPPQLILVRLVDDACTISVDSSGELLHRRGYRQAVAKAPLRETLAAGMLLASGWDRTSPLIDPFCGSGTIPIEAALLAFGIAPGKNRHFAFMDWPGFEEATWKSLVGPSPAVHQRQPSIIAADRDAGAIEMARANAERAGVAEHIQFACQAISDLQAPPGPGWVVTNPPYGLRVSVGRDLRDLYARFGAVLRRECPGWQVAVLCSQPHLFGQMGMEWDTSLELVNGGVRVRLGRGQAGR